MASFLTLKTPFCEYELATNQGDAAASDKNKQEPSRLDAIKISLKER